jgi:broad specificity phosphatase PhoE
MNADQVNQSNVVVVLLRHGQSQANASQAAAKAHNLPKPESELDPPLTDLGEVQAASWCETTKAWLKLQLVLVSPLWRTIQTATYAFGACQQPRLRFLLTPEAREHWWSDLENRGNPRELLQARAAELPTGFGGRLEGWEKLEPNRFWSPIEEPALSRRELVRRAQETTKVLVQQLCSAAEELGCHVEQGLNVEEGLSSVKAPSIAVVCHWGVIAQLTDLDVSNCSAVFLNFDRHEQCAEEDSTVRRKQSNRACQAAHDIGWHYTVTNVVDTDHCDQC